MSEKRFKPRRYKTGDIIIKQGDISDFMVIIYQGDIGVYLNIDFSQPYEYKNLKSNPVAVKSAKDILGEQGLLKGTKRGATCIAITEVLLFTMTADQYAYMIESFHKSEMFKNIKFLGSLEFTGKFPYTKVELLAK